MQGTAPKCSKGRSIRPGHADQRRALDSRLWAPSTHAIPHICPSRAGDNLACLALATAKGSMKLSVSYACYLAIAIHGESDALQLILSQIIIFRVHY